MYSFDLAIRVRYNETDRMGYLHHSYYPVYFEITRTEMLRNLGTTYKKLEEAGIFMPVYELNIKYKLPGFYDDLLTVTATIDTMPVSKLNVKYQVQNEKKQLICLASSTNVYVSAKSMKPVRAPEYLMNRFRKFF